MAMGGRGCNPAGRSAEARLSSRRGPVSASVFYAGGRGPWPRGRIQGLAIGSLWDNNLIPPPCERGHLAPKAGHPTSAGQSFRAATKEAR